MLMGGLDSWVGPKERENVQLAELGAGPED